MHQFAGKLRKPIKFSLSKSVFDENVFPFDITQVAEGLSESIKTGCVGGTGLALTNNLPDKFFVAAAPERESKTLRAW